MEVFIKIAAVIFGFAAFIYALTRTEYEECDGTGCDLCPFPRCEDAPKDLTKAQMRKMEGEIVTIVLDDSVIPVKIVIKDNDVWVENSFGTSTTYDDVKRNGGKFFEKKKNKS